MKEQENKAKQIIHIDFFFFITAEWETTKIPEPVKEVASQPVSTEATVVSNTQTETYSQQVTMMPVQVHTSVVLSGNNSKQQG